jgi:hypothetical protein
MPQLLKLVVYDSYWFQRGVRSADNPSEFLWKGLDGTAIAAFWLPRGYGLFYHSGVASVRIIDPDGKEGEGQRAPLMPDRVSSLFSVPTD